MDLLHILAINLIFTFFVKIVQLKSYDVFMSLAYCKQSLKYEIRKLKKISD